MQKIQNSKSQAIHWRLNISTFFIFTLMCLSIIFTSVNIAGAVPQESANGVNSCDLNQDGAVNIQDVIICVNAVLDGSSSNIADVNGDGLVNIQDVITIVNIVLQGGPEPPDPQNCDEIQIDLSSSRTSGVAPLSVFFDASQTTGVQTDRPFHELDYSWEFGDPASGTWSVSGLPKNVDKGPLAAHVFESPGTYTITLKVRDGNQCQTTQQVTVTVDDPDVVYAGENTICFSDTASNDFSGCPTGALQIASDDITQIKDHISTNKRVLLHRGSSWESSETVGVRGTNGPVTIGAYGDCVNINDQGICENAPLIQLSGDHNSFFSISNASDWRIGDLHFIGDDDYSSVIGGATNINSVLISRLKTEGFKHSICIANWETDGHDQIMVANCDISDSHSNTVFLGSERLVLMGNNIRNSSTTHIVRVWQAYLSVISHNQLSGSSLNNDAGRQALKLHGPRQELLSGDESNSLSLKNPSSYIVLSNNIFGGSGPWPVAVGPQNNQYDERLNEIIIEKNRFLSGYGNLSSRKVQIALSIWASNVTVRNNVFDGTNSERSYTGINVSQRGIEPPPSNNQIYNNTIYKADCDEGYSHYRGILIKELATQTVVKNNLIHLPSAGTIVEMIQNHSSDLIADHNLLTDAPGLVDPDNSDLLLKDFSLMSSSPAIDAGSPVPLFEDFTGGIRPENISYDLGAFEFDFIE